LFSIVLLLVAIVAHLAHTWLTITGFAVAILVVSHFGTVVRRELAVRHVKRAIDHSVIFLGRPAPPGSRVFLS
jgi:hypothetical protein